MTDRTEQDTIEMRTVIINGHFRGVVEIRRGITGLRMYIVRPAGEKSYTLLDEGQAIADLMFDVRPERQI